MEIKQLESALEAILFASGEPVALERLARVLEVEQDLASMALQQLGDHLSFEMRGIRLVKMDEAYQLCTPVEYSDYIRRALQTRKAPPLSKPALEVLAIIAYYQPTTRTYIDQIRGVDSSYTTGLLVEKGLVEECGRLDVPGRPILYRTTQDFLRSFGLTSLADMPDLPTGESESQLSLSDAIADVNGRTAQPEGERATASDSYPAPEGEGADITPEAIGATAGE